MHKQLISVIQYLVQLMPSQHVFMDKSLATKWPLNEYLSKKTLVST